VTVIQRPDATAMHQMRPYFNFPDKRMKSSYGGSASSRSVKPCQRGIRGDRTETVTRTSGNGTDGGRNT